MPPVVTRVNFADLAAKIDANRAESIGPIVDLTACTPKIDVPDIGESFKAMLEVLGASNTARVEVATSRRS